MVELCRRPLIQWTIDAALGSTHVDRILVSTDDPAVASLAAPQDLQVLERPASIAGDSATAAQVIAHALEAVPDDCILVYLQPTSPLREAADIDASLELLLAGSSEGIVSVTAVSEYPEWMYRMDATSRVLTPVIPDHSSFRRQDVPRTVRLNGAVYCAPAARLRPDGNFFRLTLGGYEMPPERSIDIDTLHDLEIARRLLGEESA